MARYAVSDIHGCLSTFEALLSEINFSKGDELYVLGDYIDRGPDSRGVIDLLMKLQDDGYHVVCLKGNHEELMLEARHDYMISRNWLATAGGEATLKSFWVTNLFEVDTKYWNWLKDLPTYIELPDYILVHAGLNFKIKNPLEDTKSMRWIRDWYDLIDFSWLNGRVVVHGHTPVDPEDIRKQAEYLKHSQVLKPYINIDAGCIFNRVDRHHLCAFNLDTKDVVLVKNQDVKVSL